MPDGVTLNQWVPKGCHDRELWGCDPKLPHRFAALIGRPTAGGCWPWRGDRNAKGYGRVGVRRSPGKWSTRRAHRVMWRLAHGAIPDGLRVLHHCDNPCCVNPNHLFLGSPKDNTQDMLRKRRAAGHWPCGEAHPHATLSGREVWKVVNMWLDGVPQTRIARRFGCGHSAIYAITHGVSWSHLTGIGLGNAR